ncbi:MAG: arylsulfotransferase family protein [Thermoleophilia bacterium]|nr:arylsulfotransferase family protein [Thermoleophilia bacterium]
MRPSLTRRDLLVAAGLGAAALAAPGSARARAAHGRAATPGAAAFVTEPSLRPPTMRVTTSAGPSPGFLFVASLNGPGQRGPMIVDNRGEVVWFRPVESFAVDFRRQVFAGKQVLTWWEGQITNGVGVGEGVIVDQRYVPIARVRAGNGFDADVHEFLLTPRRTALLTIYKSVPADLSSVGGPAAGQVLDSIVQEVDIASGRVLFEWHSLEHVALGESYAPLLDPFDYFHINSVDVDLDGNLVVSARNTSAVYKIDRASGQVMWRLGGRNSDFDLGPGADFMYQHDARAHTNGTLTLFDNGPSQTTKQSRAIRLGLDHVERRAYLLQQYRHPTELESTAMGNAQVLDGDSVLVGWGTEPWVTEFGPGGEVRFDATFDGGAWNYRAFRLPWVGRPTARPKVVARRSPGGLTVYASWNGSTETAYWQVLAGETRERLTRVKTATAAGFETVVRMRGRPRFVAVTALDRRRVALARSPVVAPRR